MRAGARTLLGIAAALLACGHGDRARSSSEARAREKDELSALWSLYRYTHVQGGRVVAAAEEPQGARRLALTADKTSEILACHWTARTRDSLDALGMTGCLPFAAVMPTPSGFVAGASSSRTDISALAGWNPLLQRNVRSLN